MHSLSIMIVDDSTLTMKQLNQFLRELGHRIVFTAQTGKEALDNYSIYNPDLVTMDITMPDMDGITATTKILEKFPEARIIMVTSHRQEQSVLEAIKAGAKGYIIKPFQKDKLRETIEKVIQKFGNKR